MRGVDSHGMIIGSSRSLPDLPNWRDPVERSTKGLGEKKERPRKREGPTRTHMRLGLIKIYNYTCLTLLALIALSALVLSAHAVAKIDRTCHLEGFVWYDPHDEMPEDPDVIVHDGTFYASEQVKFCFSDAKSLQEYDVRRRYDVPCPGDYGISIKPNVDAVGQQPSQPVRECMKALMNANPAVDAKSIIDAVNTDAQCEELTQRCPPIGNNRDWYTYHMVVALRAVNPEAVAKKKF